MPGTKRKVIERVRADCGSFHSPCGCSSSSGACRVARRPTLWPRYLHSHTHTRHSLSGCDQAQIAAARFHNSQGLQARASLAPQSRGSGPRPHTWCQSRRQTEHRFCPLWRIVYVCVSAAKQPSLLPTSSQELSNESGSFGKILCLIHSQLSLNIISFEI